MLVCFLQTVTSTDILSNTGFTDAHMLDAKVGYDLACTHEASVPTQVIWGGMMLFGVFHLLLFISLCLLQLGMVIVGL